MYPNRHSGINLWQIKKEINQIKQLQQSRETTKYYDIVVYLATDILNANIVP